MKSKLETYALAVCFASIICLMISSAVAFNAIFSIVSPETTIYSTTFQKYQTNEMYVKKVLDSRTREEVKGLSDEELTAKRENAFNVELVPERRKGLQSLIRSLFFCLSGLIVFFIHWVIGKNARKQSET